MPNPRAPLALHFEPNNVMTFYKSVDEDHPILYDGVISQILQKLQFPQTWFSHLTLLFLNLAAKSLHIGDFPTTNVWKFAWDRGWTCIDARPAPIPCNSHTFS